MMKKLIVLILAGCSLMISCSKCVECNGTSYCEESGASYTDSNGNNVSWEEYSAIIKANCP